MKNYDQELLSLLSFLKRNLFHRDTALKFYVILFMIKQKGSSINMKMPLKIKRWDKMKEDIPIKEKFRCWSRS
jgi:hypothetical protein